MRLKIRAHHEWKLRREYTFDLLKNTGKRKRKHAPSNLVEKVLACKRGRMGDNDIYLVKWYGLSDDFNTWEEAGTFSSNVPLQKFGNVGSPTEHHKRRKKKKTDETTVVTLFHDLRQ